LVFNHCVREMTQALGALRVGLRMAGEGISNVIAGVSREERALEWTLANSTAGNPGTT